MGILAKKGMTEVEAARAWVALPSPKGLAWFCSGMTCHANGAGRDRATRCKLQYSEAKQRASTVHDAKALWKRIKLEDALDVSADSVAKSEVKQPTIIYEASE